MVEWSSPAGINEHGTMLWNIIVVCFLLFSGSFIFIDMSKRQQRLAMLMLPAPMPTKFVARYIMTFVVSVITFAVGYFAADVLQYLIMLVINHEKAGFIESSLFVDSYYGARFAGRFGNAILPAMAVAVLAWWYHSLYLLGGVFFRKNGWLWTTLAQILFFNVVVFGLGYLVMTALDSMYPEGFYLVMLDNAGTWAKVAYFIVMLGFTALNYWLSYRIFSRIQLINNKWTNI